MICLPYTHTGSGTIEIYLLWELLDVQLCFFFNLRMHYIFLHVFVALLIAFEANIVCVCVFLVYCFLWDRNFNSELCKRKFNIYSYLNLHLRESEWNTSLLFLSRIMIVIDNFEEMGFCWQNSGVPRHLFLYWSSYFGRLIQYFMFYTLYMISQNWGFQPDYLQIKSNQGYYFTWRKDLF